MKKLIAFLLTLTMVFSLTAIPSLVSANDGEAYLFKSDFEDVVPGKKLQVIGGVYSEVAQVDFPQTLFAEVSGQGLEVVKESDEIDNNVLRVASDTDSSITATMSKSVRANPAQSGVRCFDFSFRVKSLGSICQISFQNYGGSGGTFKPFVLNGQNISCMGSVGASVETDKWNYIKIHYDLNSNIIDLYVNKIKEYSGPIYSEYNIERLPSLIYVTVSSTVAEGKECFWDDFLVKESVDEVVKKVPDNYDAYRNVRPRILVDSNGFERIKNNVTKDIYKNEWDSLIAQADGLIAEGVTEYYVVSSDEENWMRDYADALMNLALVAKITGNKEYREHLRKAVDTVINYPQWGRGDFYNCDLACAHMLVFLSMYYDWFYDDIGANERYNILSVVKERGGKMSKKAWWRNSYLQNHSWNCSAAMMVASAAFFEDIPEARNWANVAKDMYDTIFSLLGEDGASHEGLMYWGYGTRFISYFLETADKFLNIDYSKHGYLENASRYFESMLVPTKSTIKPFRFADYSENVEPITSGVLTYLATKYQDPLTQWYAELTRERIPQADKSFYAFFYLIYNDENLKSTSPEEAKVSLNKYFDDMGFLFMRSGFEENDTAIAYRCGPALGKKAQIGFTRGDLGTGHVHNDINSMQIFTRGQNLLAEDMYGGGDTASHNTILVNGYGHMTDNGPNNGFTPIAPRGVDADPKIEKVVENENYVYSIGNGTEIYDKDKTGLLKFRRHFIYLKPDILLVADEIETEERDDKIPVEIRYFPESQNYTANRDGTFDFKTDHYNFVINPIVSGNAKAEAANVLKVFKGSSSEEKVVIRILNDENKFLQPVAMSWSDPDKKPEKITAKTKENGIVEFYTNDAIVTLDTINETVSYEKADSKVILKKDGELIKINEESLVFENSRFFANEDLLADCFGIKTTKQENAVVYSLGSKQAEIEKDSDKVILSDREIQMDTKAFESNGKFYAPIRFVLQAFSMDCAWDGETSNLNVTTNVDFSDASLYSLVVNGTVMEVGPDKTHFSVPVFGEKVDLKATASLASAKLEYRPCDGLHGMSEILITSLDGKTTKTYTIETTEYVDICDTVIYNLGFSESDGNLGGNAIDHNLDTRWAAFDEGQFLWYDLGSVKDINSVKLAFYNGNKRTIDFDIEVSDDGVNYTKMGHFTSCGTTNDPEEFILENARGRFVRFYGYGAAGSGWNSVTEMGIVLK